MVFQYPLGALVRTICCMSPEPQSTAAEELAACASRLEWPAMAAIAHEVVRCALLSVQGGAAVDAAPGQPDKQPRAGSCGGVCCGPSLRELTRCEQHASCATALCPGARSVLRAVVTAALRCRTRTPCPPQIRMCASRPVQLPYFFGADSIRQAPRKPPGSFISVLELLGQPPESREAAQNA